MQYHVADIVLDSASRLVRGPQGPLPVPRRVFDCLIYLIEHRERAVARDEIILYVWNRPNVSDTQLAQTVLRARRLLRDDGSEQRLIRTVPGFGYHWIGAVCVGDGVDAEAAASAAAAVAVVDVAPVAAPAAVAGIGEVPPIAEPAIRQSSTDPSARAVPMAPEPTDSSRAPADDAARPVIAATAHATARAASPATRHRWSWLAAAAVIVAAVLALSSFGTTYLPAGVSAAASVPRRVVILPVEMGAGTTDDMAWARLGLMDLLASRLRAQGLVVPPSESVLAAMAALPAQPAGGALRPQALQADLLVQPRLSRLSSGWTFSLEGRRANGADLRLQHQHPQVLQAAAAAGDALLATLGRGASAGAAAGDETALRLRAALLGNELQTIHAWLAALPPAQRSDRETRYLAAELDYRAGRLDASRAALDALLQDAEIAADAAFRGRVLAARGSVAMRQRDDAASERDFAAAIVALDGSGGRDLGRAFMGRGGIALRQQRLADAEADLTRARSLLDAAGDDIGVARAEVNLALLDRRQGRPLEALEQLQSAAARFGNYAAVNELSATLVSLVDLQCGLLRWNDALANSERAQRLLPQLPDRQLRVRVRQSQVDALLGLGRLDDAAAALEAIAREGAASDADTARSALLAAELALARGDHAQAGRAARAIVSAHAAQRDLVLRAAQILQELQLPLPELVLPPVQDHAPDDVDLLLLRGLALHAQASPAAAESCVREALRSASLLRDPRTQRQALQVVAALLRDEGRGAEAFDLAAPLAAQVAHDYDTAVLFARLHRERRDAANWRAALQSAAALAGERRVPAALSLPWPRGEDTAQVPRIARAAVR